MQAQKGYENLNMLSTIKKIYKTEGFIGYYRYNLNLIIILILSTEIYSRGCIPPLWGSGIFRSFQFSSFEAV